MPLVHLSFRSSVCAMLRTSTLGGLRGTFLAQNPAYRDRRNNCNSARHRFAGRQSAEPSRNPARNPDADWPMYNRDLGGTRCYSPLTQINTTNVEKLTKALLFDLVKDGRTIPALVQTGKLGYMFILNRETGAPLYPIEERPVPKGNAPGEVYAPTQPIPVKPGPIARVSMSAADLVTAADTTPAQATNATNCGTR